MNDLEKFKQLIEEKLKLYERSFETYDLCTEERNVLLKIEVKALSSIILAASESKFSGYLYLRDRFDGIENFHLAINFVEGVAYYSKYSWGWEKRIPARKFASLLKIAS